MILANLQKSFNMAGHRLTLLILVSFYTLWFLVTLPAFNMPHLTGYDSVTRLLRYQELLVDLNGNVWLPFLQFFIRSIRLLVSDLWYFKLFNYLIALAGMTFYYLAVQRAFGIFPAVASLCYFLMHEQWIGISTSLYMEPLFLLFLALAIWNWQSGKKLLFGLFFIFASFTRPELLMALPALLIVTMLYYRNWKPMFYLGLLYLPVIIFYVWLKYQQAEFYLPANYDWALAMQTARSIVDVYLTNRLFMLEGLCVLAGIAILAFTKNQLADRRLLLSLLAALGIFALTFCLSLPFFHEMAGGGNGGTRKSIYLALPSFIFAGMFLRELYGRFRQPALCCSTALITLAVCSGVYTPVGWPVWSYQMAEKIDLELRKTYSPDHFHYLCDFSTKQKDHESFQSIVINQLQFYLEQQGWKLEVIPCSENTLWKPLSKSQDRFVLRIYDSFQMEADFASKLNDSCRVTNLIRDRRNIKGRYCF